MRGPSPIDRRTLLRLLAVGAWAGGAGTLARASAPASAADAVLRVGPGQALKTPSAAAAVAPDGALVEVEAGDYAGDVAVWTQRRLSLRAVGGRVHLQAAGRSAEGKAIWVVRGGEVEIEGFDFSGTRVAARNGAGIRHEAGQLRVRDCRFVDNENGILTSNDRAVALHIEGCEFGLNGHGDGLSHNLYAGGIGRLSITGSWFHDARGGHLVKSRAEHNELRYNRLADAAGGNSSYELEFPSGGTAIVVGNLIEQAASTQNPHLLSFGVEGYAWPRNELQLVHNTLVDRRKGVFLRVSPGAGTVDCLNNLLLGDGDAGSWLGDESRGNYRAVAADLQPESGGTPWLRPSAYARRRAVPAAQLPAPQLLPTRQYLHPLQTVALRRRPVDPGAFQRPELLAPRR